MTMEKVAVFIDYGSLSIVLKKEKLQIDLVSLRDYLTEGRILTEVFCYIDLNSLETREGQNFYQSLRINGFLVSFQEVQVDNSIKGSNAIQFALDVADYIYAVKPDIVVIVTGEENYGSLANWLRLRGVRVEVASIPNSVSQELMKSANGFIDLFQAVKEIQRTDEGKPEPGKEVMGNGGSNR